MQLIPWINAFRLRTLPLALSCSVLGSFLAASHGAFNWWIFSLCVLTTLFLQILSNLANDLGDYQHGTDDENREGPKRALQLGTITEKQMKFAIVVFIALSLISGILLLWYSFKDANSLLPLVFFFTGVGAIFAAVKYTYGKSPYGYAGWGDFFVFVFFGLVGVFGTYFLHTQQANWIVLLPASGLGLLSAGVLNLNNIRDIKNDSEKGKVTIPVRLGEQKALVYHSLLIWVAVLLVIIYFFWLKPSYWLLVSIPVLPLLLRHQLAVKNQKKTAKFDKELKYLALTTFIFSVLVGLSQLLAHWK